MSSQLTTHEQAQLVQHETIIDRGIQTFYEVGGALASIRDGRLYRQDYSTFEDYCQERWGLKQARTYQFIDAAKARANLESSTMVELPTSERQTRPLTRLPAEQQPEVWQRAVETAPNGKITAAHVQRVVDEWRDSDPLPFEPTPLPPTTNQQRAQQFGLMLSRETNEWYTPPHIIGLARDVLGGIDLDPASCAVANQTVRADAYYDKDLDGLMQPWEGRVWLNPPYSGNQELWARRLIAEYTSGSVSSALLLVKAALGYNWFERLWYAYPTCFLRERLSFIPSDGAEGGQAKHATALMYFGSDTLAFTRGFRPLGRIIFPEAEE